MLVSRRCSRGERRDAKCYSTLGGKSTASVGFGHAPWLGKASTEATLGACWRALPCCHDRINHFCPPSEEDEMNTVARTWIALFDPAEKPLPVMCEKAEWTRLRRTVQATIHSLRAAFSLSPTPNDSCE